MARVSKPVDRGCLEAALKTAEVGGPLKNLNELWNRAAELYNAMPGIPEQISHSVVMLRATEWKIPILTQPGKRGRSGPLTDEQKQAMQAGRVGVVRQPRAAKFASNPRIAAGFKKMREVFRELAGGSDRWESLIDRAEKGSDRAAKFLNCVQCMGGSARDARDCDEACCPMYASTCGVFKRGQQLLQIDTEPVLDLEEEAA